MKSKWDDVPLGPAEDRAPNELIQRWLSGLEDKTQGRVTCRVQKVRLFESERPTREELEDLRADAAEDWGAGHELKHFGLTGDASQDLGYDPKRDIRRRQLRYRTVLRSPEDPSLEFELFKFAFPLDFFPVRVMVDPAGYPELSEAWSSLHGDIECQTAAELEEVIDTIIHAEATRRTISKMMALSAA